MSPQRYLSTSRQPRYSLLFALPLLLLYEALAAALSGSAFAGVRNGADVLLKTLFVILGGRSGLVVFGTLLLGIGAWHVWRDMQRRPERLSARVFALMFGESLILAAMFGNVVSYLTVWFLGGGTLAKATQTPMAVLPLSSQLMVSLGAGLYEELLFRVLLVGALLALTTRFGWSRSAAVAFSLVVSALIFSAFHYIGPYGDPLTVPSFTFRAIAGVLLSGLYVARGFGITAWTHALYDVGLAVL